MSMQQARRQMPAQAGWEGIANGEASGEPSSDEAGSPRHEPGDTGDASYKLAQTLGVWRKLDEWLRHRLRAIQLKQWKRGTTMYRELRKLGATDIVARRVAGNSRRWWHNSAMLLHTVLTIAYFDRLGVPRLS